MPNVKNTEMTDIRLLCRSTIFLTFLFLLVGFKNDQTKHNPHLIEEYRGDLNCPITKNQRGKIILNIYSDSTYTLQFRGCKNDYPSKKEYRRRKRWKAYGTWTGTGNQRKFFQTETEMTILKQGDGFVMYQDTKLTKV